MKATEVRINEDSAVIIYTEGRKGFSTGIMPSSIGSYKKSSIDKKLKIANWYDDSKNREPENVLNVLLGNNIAPAILDTKAKFITGNGIKCYKEEIIAGKKRLHLQDIPEIDDWIEKTDLNDAMFNAAKDAQFFGNAFFEMLFNKAKKVDSINHVDATTVRAQEASPDGRVHAYYLCGDWAKPKYVPDNETAGNVYKVNAHLEITKQESDVQDWALNSLFPKCIYHVKDYTPGLPYYALPGWYGSLKWIELANTIPSWHLSGIKNGYSVRYLVEVSEAYFARFTDEEQVVEAKKKLQDDLDACLAGTDNVGKTIYAVMTPQHFADKGVIRITPISTDLHDEAFSILFEHSNTAATSGFAIDPTLCGIETQGKLSSGSEKRIAYQLWLRLHAVRPRQSLLRVMNTVKALNGWGEKYPGLKFGFENVELTTLDVNPTGVENIIAG